MSKALLMTVTCATGIVAGALLGLGVGSLFENESVVITGYTVGFVLGAVCGASIGKRLHSRRFPMQDLNEPG